MNFGGDADAAESEKANTPFEDSCRVLKTGLNVDRQVALDNFLLNSCLVHDMTIVTNALFHGGAGSATDDDLVEQVKNVADSATLEEMNQVQNT